MNETEWNNVARNAFEAIGMIGDISAERFVDDAVGLLHQCDAHKQNRPIVFYKTQWNIVRCLERLHRSAPRPYAEHMMTVAWPRQPSFEWFGAVAIRGFHMRRVEPGYFPPMQYLRERNESDNPKQREVSDCLLSVLEGLRAQPSCDGDAKYLEVNCTHALIRWLHEADVTHAKNLLGQGGLSADSKGNLFQAFLRFKKPEIFEGGSQLFAGMTLWWSYVTRAMLPEGFVFRNVTFQKRASRILGFKTNDFEN